jgi:hypothetical protein
MGRWSTRAWMPARLSVDAATPQIIGTLLADTL